MDDELTLHENTSYTGRGPFLTPGSTAPPHHPLSSIRMCSPVRSDCSRTASDSSSLAEDEIILKPRPALTALPRYLNKNTNVDFDAAASVGTKTKTNTGVNAHANALCELTPPASPELRSSHSSTSYSAASSTSTSYSAGAYNPELSGLKSPGLSASGLRLPNLNPSGSKDPSNPRSSSPTNLFGVSANTASTQLSAAKFGSALSRAGSVFQRKPQSPTPSSSPSHSPVRRHKASKSLADFLGVQGSSAPVSFGLPASFSNTNIGINNTKKNEDMPVRPQHMRRASTFASITSSLGLRAPSRIAKSDMVDEEDEFLALDLDAELFPQGLPAQATPAAFDDLLANAEKLFLRMHAAYRSRVRELQEATSKQDVEQQELEDAMTRANHLKLQLTELSARNEDQECTIRSLSQELEGSQRRNMASIRMIHSPILLSDSEENECERGERLFSNNAFETESEISSAPGSVFSSRPGSADGSTTMTVSTLPTEDGRGRATALPMTWSGMREENEALKGRVEELEKVIHLTLGSLSDLGV